MSQCAFWGSNSVSWKQVRMVRNSAIKLLTVVFPITGNSLDVLSWGTFIICPIMPLWTLVFGNSFVSIVMKNWQVWRITSIKRLYDDKSPKNTRIPPHGRTSVKHVKHVYRRTPTRSHIAIRIGLSKACHQSPFFHHHLTDPCHRSVTHQSPVSQVRRLRLAEAGFAPPELAGKLHVPDTPVTSHGYSTSQRRLKCTATRYVEPCYPDP